ncbi:hypothetical protein [Streptomyces eurythermus]|uniref:hypothetical protein n=1 Tax=Streptomyces eurythermus TaxID=42237 RepID=UPI0036FBE879
MATQEGELGLTPGDQLEVLLAHLFDAVLLFLHGYPHEVRAEVGAAVHGERHAVDVERRDLAVRRRQDEVVGVLVMGENSGQLDETTMSALGRALLLVMTVLPCIRCDSGRVAWKPEIVRRLGADPDQPEDPRPTALVAAALACADAASTGWVACEGKVPLAVLLDRAMGAFADGGLSHK